MMEWLIGYVVGAFVFAFVIVVLSAFEDEFERLRTLRLLFIMSLVWPYMTVILVGVFVGEIVKALRA